MTDPSPAPDRFASRAVVVALLATLVYAALVIAVSGVLSLLLDRDVVEGEHSILVGLVMPITAVTVVGVACLRGAQLRVLARRAQPTAPMRPSVGAALVGGVAAWLGAAVAGGLAVWVESGSVLHGLGFAGDRLGSPFTIADGVLAVPTVLLCALLVASPDEPGGPARWPWEDEDGR
ncbi:hypothetical protein [Mycetocola reblochoni]|uniref:Uncharacterized protein n=2 Tax=Mycetocola reblochoni TaxID=331618 RepID=A0A1R4ICZ9_9MICO|nr:hypothetical protein [Mycetocola reblochoni]RLP69117.1 hypothetical protein D9V30_07310 [Mycetocola reblochoni]SJN17606.1 hypothetical protein FM119_01050 [Mycetocola reblochoni REB411]